MAGKSRELSKEHQFAIKLMQHLVVPTFVLNADGDVIIWNKACERLTGLSADEVIGTKNHWRAFYDSPRDCLADVIAHNRYEELDALYAVHAEPGDIHSGLTAENWCVMPQASKRLYLAIDAGPIYDDHGELIAVVETLRDLTERKQALIALESLAHKDGLTGLANRRSFDLTLESELERAERRKEHLALILCDIDHFKRYNDLYGHQKGDECLKEVAKAIEGEVGRPTDLACRYGGEEFAVILPGVDAEGALVVAESIRKAIFDLNEPHEDSRTSDRVTMSLGALSLIPAEETTSTDLIEAADKALYKAKEGGRNRVVSAVAD